MYDLIVIGAGPGGYQAAAHAGQLGMKVALIEKDRIGGTCLNAGCIPAKAFLRSARVCRECREAAAFGVHVDGFGVDLPAVVERKNGIVAALAKGVDDLLARAGVEVHGGSARIVARDRVQVGDQVLQAANLLIATGARPAVPPIPGIAAAHVIDSDSAFDRTIVPSRVAILGADYIGLEFATFFGDIGAEVAVFETSPHVARGFDRDVADRLRQSMQRAGIVFHLSCRVDGISDDVVRYADSSGPGQSYPADLILNATGRVPVVTDLGLEEAGVDFSASGIPITDEGRTNVPGIWACGDVTGRHMLAHVATREAIAAVNTMAGRPDRIRYDAIPSVIYTHPEVASAGRTEAELEAASVAYAKTVVPMGVAGRFLIENEHGSGFLKLLTGAAYGEVLGVHVVADFSSEFIVAGSALIESELPVSDAAQIVFPHPTVSEALGEAIRRAQQGRQP